MSFGPALKISVQELGQVRKKIWELIERASDLEEFNQEAAEYMVRSTQHRILRSKKEADGKPFAALRELTIELKGHDKPLFETGELARSVHVEEADNDGFTVRAEAFNDSGDDYAFFVQHGRRQTKGRFRSGRRVPSRKFMGFSEANINAISKMLRDYVNNGGGSAGRDDE